METAPTNQENLTSQQQLHVHIPANEQDRPPEPTAVVRLLNAVKIPGRHQKIVKAQINKQYVATRGLFEPIPEFASEMGLTIAEAFVEPDGEHCINLILENMDLKATEVEPGKILGTVASAEMQGPPPDAEVSAEPPGDVPEDVTLAQLQLDTRTEERIQRILQQLCLDPKGLTPNKLSQIKELIVVSQDLFALAGSELGMTDMITHSIDTGDHKPIRQQMRRTPFALRQKIEDLTQEMLEQGVVQPSRSPWASPVVLVRKKDGGMRFCVDYRRLNAITKMDVFPLPRIDDTLDLLSKAKYFTTLDLASGYWQVEMSPDSREKTAFITHSGCSSSRKCLSDCAMPQQHFKDSWKPYYRESHVRTVSFT